MVDVVVPHCALWWCRLGPPRRAPPSCTRPERNETRYERPPITFATILAAMARTGLLRHPPRRREIALPLCKRRKALSAACSWDSFSLGKPRGAVTGASLGTRCLDDSSNHTGPQNMTKEQNTPSLRCGAPTRRGKRKYFHDCRRHYLLQCGGAAQLQHEPSSAIPWL